MGRLLPRLLVCRPILIKDVIVSVKVHKPVRVVDKAVLGLEMVL
jgi:hypothetical protein